MHPFKKTSSKFGTIALACSLLALSIVSFADVDMKNIKKDIKTIKEDIAGKNNNKAAAITYTDPQKVIMVKKLVPTFEIISGIEPHYWVFLVVKKLRLRHHKGDQQ